jgi:aryl-alcohol dehydrogenase-like predicted oxidoreductase
VIPRTTLAPGYSISRLIKGGWQLAGGHGTVDREQALADMFRFVDSGLTTFDCADIYTGVEELIGAFRERYRERHGGEALRGLQVHTKYVPDRAALPRLTRGDVETAIDRSRARLGMEALDLVQFHWWDYDVPGYVDAAGYLADLLPAGKVRHLGVTNFDVPRLRELLVAGIPLVSHQLQYSVVDHRPERGMAELCRQHGIGLLCYGTLLGGFLSRRWLGAAAPAAPLENRSLVKYALIVEEFGGWARFQDVFGVLARIAERQRVEASTVAVRFILDKPQVSAAIVGARHADHLPATLATAAFRLDEEDRLRIEAAIGQGQGPGGDVYDLERFKGGSHAAIMKYGLNQAGAG